jgi:hypothetical protein
VVAERDWVRINCSHTTRPARDGRAKAVNLRAQPGALAAASSWQRSHSGLACRSMYGDTRGYVAAFAKSWRRE